jgi:uncharacterized protein DUF5996
VADVTQEVLAAVERLAGAVRINQKPQEVSWETPLDEDREHATYVPEEVSSYFTAAREAARVLSEYRAPFRGRASPVNAWWGAFDLATVIFSGRAAEPPADDFISRNGGDAEQISVGWWPGDERYGRAAFIGYPHPAPDGLSDAELEPAAAHWDDQLGEFVLDWNDIREQDDAHELALAFARSVAEYGCAACNWDPALARSVFEDPPPIR